MNCQHFQNELHEYVEGSLPPVRQRAADEHLNQCGACRQLLRQEQRVAQTLSQEFRQTTTGLMLPPDFQARLLIALHKEAAEKVTPLPEPNPGWARFAWPVAIAACVLFTSFRLSYFFPDAPTPEITDYKSAAVSPPDISVHFVYCEPTHVFRKDGNQIVDAIICEPRTVDMTFHQNNQKPL